MTQETTKKRPEPVTDPKVRAESKWVNVVNECGTSGRIPECDLPAWEFDGWKRKED